MSESISAVLIPEEPNEPGAASLTPDIDHWWVSTLFVHEGQVVEAGQLLARLEMKSTLHALLSPHDGYVVGLHASAGQMVPPGQVLCYICPQPSLAGSYRKILPDRLLRGAAPDPSSLIIFGGGGHGKAVIDLVRSLGTYRIVGIIDDGLPQGSEVMGVTVLGKSAELEDWAARGITQAVNAVGGIGNVNIRLKVFDLLARAGFSCPTLVHPSAVVERSAVLEAGVQVLAQAYVGSAARVGFGTLVNTDAIVSHDCVIGQVVNLSPGATLAGNVRVEDHAQIGMRATVNVQVTVGKGARLGNGCTVKADVPAGGRVYAGTIWPVREVKSEK